MSHVMLVIFPAIIFACNGFTLQFSIKYFTLQCSTRSCSFMPQQLIDRVLVYRSCPRHRTCIIKTGDMRPWRCPRHECDDLRGSALWVRDTVHGEEEQVDAYKISCRWATLLFLALHSLPPAPYRRSGSTVWQPIFNKLENFFAMMDIIPLRPTSGGSWALFPGTVFGLHLRCDA